jgi:hypothetical protein
VPGFIDNHQLETSRTLLSLYRCNELYYNKEHTQEISLGLYKVTLVENSFEEQTGSLNSFLPMHFHLAVLRRRKKTR